MATRVDQSYTRPMVAAIAEGATTPNPGTVNAVVLSSVTGQLLRWTGSAWAGIGAAVPAYASLMKFRSD